MKQGLLGIIYKFDLDYHHLAHNQNPHSKLQTRELNLLPLLVLLLGLLIFPYVSAQTTQSDQKLVRKVKTLESQKRLES